MSTENNICCTQIQSDTSSDYRLKNIEDIKNALETLLQLKGIRYAWNAECQEKYAEDFDNKKHLGFIAQEVAKVFSDWISLGKTYKVGNEEFQALGIRVSPTLFEFQALTVEALREIDTRLRAAEESIKDIYQKLEAGTSSLAAIASALTDLQLRQLHQDDRIRKIEQKLRGN